MAVAVVAVFWMQSKLDEVAMAAVVVAVFSMQSRAAGAVAGRLPMVEEEDYWQQYKPAEAEATKLSIDCILLYLMGASYSNMLIVKLISLDTEILCYS